MKISDFLIFKSNNLNKENLALIKKDLKKESNFILEDFKTGLKGSINKIEEQLKDKVDKLGLDQFWNKINEQLIEEMKQKRKARASQGNC